MSAIVPTGYGVRNVYGSRVAADGAPEVTLDLSDRSVKLSRSTYDKYVRLSEQVRAGVDPQKTAQRLGLSVPEVERLTQQFARAGLFFSLDDEPETVSGKELCDHFSAKLDAWLARAFAHTFWDRMLSGQGSSRLFAGWLFELYHYTKNANRHMPLAVAHARHKGIKTKRAKHYAEEWNHYHYFAKSLVAMGFTRDQVAKSEPLPMTLAMSNFMRQAAREDILAYSICSAVLEGTTVGEQNYDGFYQKAMEHYAVPKAAVQPVYDHLALDQKYDHSDLFAEILGEVEQLEATRASRILDYGYQLVEHIDAWTDDIERYYGDLTAPVPRPTFSALHE